MEQKQQSVSLAQNAIYSVTALCAQFKVSRETGHKWLRSFLELPNGIPSHDTFRNVFAAVDPKEFMRLFARWTGGVCKSLGEAEKRCG